jgi:hypothetical protein
MSREGFRERPAHGTATDLPCVARIRPIDPCCPIAQEQRNAGRPGIAASWRRAHGRVKLRVRQYELGAASAAATSRRYLSDGSYSLVECMDIVLGSLASHGVCQSSILIGLAHLYGPLPRLATLSDCQEEACGESMRCVVHGGRPPANHTFRPALSQLVAKRFRSAAVEHDQPEHALRVVCTPASTVGWLNMAGLEATHVRSQRWLG